MVTPSPRFALLGAAGYVAPRHLQAIADVGGTLVAACDPHDSVGVLDSYFFEARFFREFERFDRYLEKLRLRGEGIDYLSICSPNYLHDAHIRAALRLGAHAICEKPVVINPWNLRPLQRLAEESGREIFPVLQLREHPTIVALRAQIQDQPEHRFQVELSYVTPRGAWYASSWKGDEERSGGVVSNIGVHLFDLLFHLFGPVHEIEVHFRDPQTCAGHLRYERADVCFVVSVDGRLLGARPVHAQRVLCIDAERVDFSSGFSRLHSDVYRRILSSGSPRLGDAWASIELTRDIRTRPLVQGSPLLHPLLRRTEK